MTTRSAEAPTAAAPVTVATSMPDPVPDLVTGLVRRCSRCGARLASHTAPDMRLCGPCERTVRLAGIHAPQSTPDPAPVAVLRVVEPVPPDERNCNGPHAAAPAADAVRIDWRHVCAGERVGRVVEETCTRCPVTVMYDLIARSGGRTIRRTRMHRGRRLVEESGLTIPPVATRLWQRLMTRAAQ